MTREVIPILDPEVFNALARAVHKDRPVGNDNSKAVGGFTRVLEDKGMLDQDGRVKR